MLPILFALASACTPPPCSDCHDETQKISTPPHHVAIIGQSNAVGGGNVSDLAGSADFALVAPNPCASQELRWAPTSDDPPVWREEHQSALAPRGGHLMGPELSGGAALAAAWGCGAVEIDKYAINGTSLDRHWSPGARYPEAADGSLFDSWLDWQEEQIAARGGSLRAVWHVAGNADAALSPGRAERYHDNLTAMILASRTRFPGLPWALTVLHEETGPLRLANVAIVRAAQEDVASELADVALVYSDDLSLKDDGIHYTAPAFARLGERLAAVSPPL